MGVARRQNLLDLKDLMLQNAREAFLMLQRRASR